MHHLGPVGGVGVKVPEVVLPRVAMQAKAPAFLQSLEAAVPTKPVAEAQPKPPVAAAAKKPQGRTAEASAETAQVVEAGPAVPNVVADSMPVIAIPVPVEVVVGMAKPPEGAVPQPPSVEARTAGPATRTKGTMQEPRKVEAKSVCATPVAIAAPALVATKSEAPVPIAAGVHDAVAALTPPPAVITHGTHVAEIGTGTKADVTTTAAPKTPEPNAPEVRTLVATPQVLEVGVDSGSHGWLRVRAELGNAGEVTASVAAASAGAAESLHKELPAISAYLAAERVGVSSLVVKSASAAGLAAGPGSGGAADAERGQSGSRGRTPEWKRAASGWDSAPAFQFGGLTMNLPAAVYGNGSGSWLSVRV